MYDNCCQFRWLPEIPIIIVCLRFPWYVLFEWFRAYPFAFQASGCVNTSARQVKGQAGFRALPAYGGGLSVSQGWLKFRKYTNQLN